jgi:hypothetical protein
VGVDAFPFLAFFFGGVAGGVMRALAGSGDEGVVSSVAEGLEEGTGEERVSAGGGGGEERDVIGEEGRRDGAKVCEDSTMVKWALSSIR